MPTLVTDPDLIAQLNAPQRSDVMPSNRVWGDKEAEAAGLYETPKVGPNITINAPRKKITDPALLQQLEAPRTTFAQRFIEPSPTEGTDKLKIPLEDRALAMTRGPQVSPSAQMAGQMANLVPAASQGTTPNIEAYGGRLVSTDTFVDDAGNILYRDPQTGQIKYTNNQTQVALRDPTDQVVKVFDRSPETNESAIVGVSRVLSPGLAAGAPTARPSIAAATKAIQPTASETMATAKPYYKAFTREASRIEIPQETAAGIAERLRRSLDRIGLDPEMAGAGAKSAISRLENPSEPLTLDYLQRVKRVAQRGFNSADKNVRDGAGVLVSEINKVISEVSKTAGRNLRTADEIASTAFSQRKLQQRTDIAKLRTGRAGYGGNAVNNIKQVLSPIVQKSIEGRVTGFKPAEIEAMREIVENTDKWVSGLRLAGQLSPTKGSIATIGGASAGATAGGIVGGPVGAVVGAVISPALGAASNKLATILQAKQIERLRELVAKRSPAYAQAVKRAVERYEKAQTDFVTDPRPARLAAYVSASRALSAGLSKDGIAISSGELLKAIRGPMQSAAEGEQEPVPRLPSE